MRLDLNTEIRYPDGRRAGVLRKVILDPNGEVENVVMATARIISHDVVVPMGRSSEAPVNDLQLTLADDQANNLPPYIEEMPPASPDVCICHHDPFPRPTAYQSQRYTHLAARMQL